MIINSKLNYASPSLDTDSDIDCFLGFLQIISVKSVHLSECRVSKNI